jgi:hypothetical protein
MEIKYRECCKCELRVTDGPTGKANHHKSEQMSQQAFVTHLPNNEENSLCQRPWSRPLHRPPESPICLPTQQWPEQRSSPSTDCPWVNDITVYLGLWLAKEVSCTLIFPLYQKNYSLHPHVISHLCCDRKPYPVSVFPTFSPTSSIVGGTCTQVIRQ